MYPDLRCLKLRLLAQVLLCAGALHTAVSRGTRRWAGPSGVYGFKDQLECVVVRMRIGHGGIQGNEKEGGVGVSLRWFGPVRRTSR